MTDQATYYRPIQYLGSKIRVVDTIVKECKKLYAPGEYVLDLFSGSSIVSQSLYNSGMNVIANDVMSFSYDIAACMLNQDRKDTSISNIEYFICNIDKTDIISDSFEFFFPLIERESKLLSEKDLLGLKKLYCNISQVGNGVQPNSQISYIRNHEGFSAFKNVPLFANYYAGTYFGIKQALDIDILRNKIENEWIKNGDEWEKKILLTALYNVCSLIVHSVGKHFAQPCAITDFDKNKITNIRLFENRNYDVLDVFKTCLKNILNSISKVETGSKSFALNFDICLSRFKEVLTDKEISVIYADPPYTAQQYSRFYHIPEILHSYNYPKLQIFRGNYTQGLYPDEKYKSPFCSKTMAKGAFVSIFNIAKEHDCSLMISYSESKKENSGNERIVSKDYLIQLAKEYLPYHSEEQINFNFDYRQLNSSDKIVEDKEDKEILLIFKK